MKDFFTAYRERLERNHEQIIKLKKKALFYGFTVKYRDVDSINELLTSITILTSDLSKGVRIQFNEVPYRWTLEYDTKPSFKNGSGFSGKEYHVDEISEEWGDIQGRFHPMFIDERFEFNQVYERPENTLNEKI